MPALSAQQVDSLALRPFRTGRSRPASWCAPSSSRIFSPRSAFVNQVGELAEEAGHHPDIDIRYNKVRLALVTHDAGGLTSKDFDLAVEGRQSCLKACRESSAASVSGVVPCIVAGIPKCGFSAFSSA